MKTTILIGLFKNIGFERNVKKVNIEGKTFLCYIHTTFSYSHGPIANNQCFL